MRDDHKQALKKIKQQILSFCLRHGLKFSNGKSPWTERHLAWLKAVPLSAMLREILDEYLLSYHRLVETGGFLRFAKAEQYASFLGLVPGEQSSGNTQKRTGITKAGNSHLRRLLTESAQCYGRDQIGYKSKALKARQAGNPGEVVAYADRANERLRRKFYKLIKTGKTHNVAVSAIARELACFVWGMMMERIA